MPFFNLYTKLSFLSAGFNLLTAINIFFCLNLLTKEKKVSLLTAGLYLILFPVWLYGLVPEVFALANFLISTQIFLLIKIKIEKKIFPYLNLFFLFLGLSIAHHHLVIFFFLSYVYFIWQTPFFKKEIWQHKLKYLLLLLTGASVYLYAPIVSFFNTPLDIENAKTLQGLFNLFFRTSYGTFKAYAQVKPNLLNSFFDLFSVFIFLLHDFKPLGIIFIIGGIFYLKKIFSSIFKLLFFSTTALLFFFFYSNFYLNTSFVVATYERFLVFIYLPLIIFLGSGINYFYRLLPIWLKKYSRKLLLQKIAQIALSIIISFYALNCFLINLLVIKQLPVTKQFLLYAQDLLHTPPPNALLFLSSDHNVFLSEHLILVYRFRPDITLIPYLLDRPYIRERLKKKNPWLVFPRNNNFADFLKLNYQQTKLIFSDRPHSEGFWINYGLLWQYFPSQKDYYQNKEQITQINQKLWTDYQLPRSNYSLPKNLLFAQDILGYYSRQFWAYINYLVINKQQNTALNLAEKFRLFFKNDLLFLVTYLDLRVKAKQCQNLTEVVAHIENQTIKQSFQYLPLISFYNQCSPNKIKKQRYQQLYLRLKKIEEKK
jgi:hypothetical protein